MNGVKYPRFRHLREQAGGGGLNESTVQLIMAFFMPLSHKTHRIWRHKKNRDFVLLSPSSFKFSSPSIVLPSPNSSLHFPSLPTSSASFQIHPTERVNTAVRLQSRLRDVFGSSLNRDTGNPDIDYTTTASFLILSASPYHSTLYNLGTDTIVK
jgi:hypothetical protein